MRESVIYQDILEEGRQEEALKMVMRPLTRRFGLLDGELQSSFFNIGYCQCDVHRSMLVSYSYF